MSKFLKSSFLCTQEVHKVMLKQKKIHLFYHLICLENKVVRRYKEKKENCEVNITYSNLDLL